MTHKDVLDQRRPPIRAWREYIPVVFEGSGALSGAVIGDGAIDATTQELIGLGIAVTRQCLVAPLPTPAALPDVVARRLRWSPRRTASPFS